MYKKIAFLVLLFFLIPCKFPTFSAQDEVSVFFKTNKVEAGYALFAQRKIIIEGKLNSLELEEKNLTDKKSKAKSQSEKREIEKKLKDLKKQQEELKKQLKELEKSEKQSNGKNSAPKFSGIG